MMSKKEKYFVSVIIPTYHDWDRLQLCLNALSKQTYPKQFFEIIVVNNDPEDKAPKSLLLPENCQLLEERKPGSYAARNKALEVAKGEVYAFTDADCIPRKDWLELAVRILIERPDVYRIGGRIKIFYKETTPNVVEIYEKVFAFRQKDFVEAKGMAATGNMISRKEVFDSIGNFDDTLMSGGDAEWGMRASAQGFNIVYLHDVIVEHPARNRFSDIAKKTKRETGGHWRMTGRKGKFLSLILGFFPPVFAIWKVLGDSSYTGKEKFFSLGIRYTLRLIAAWERVRLAAGKSAERI